VAHQRSQIAVIGLGRFGTHAVKALYEADHEVLAIDKDTSAVERVKNSSTQAVVVDGRDKERLRALGLKDFDTVIISLGENIEASALMALHLRDIGVKRVIAKAGSEDHARLLEMLGVSEIIFPERQAAERLAQRLRYANLLDYIPLSGEHSIQEITPPQEFVGQTLQDLRLRNRFKVQVLAIRDARTDQLEVNPIAGYTIRESDIMIVLGDNSDLDRLIGMKGA